MIFVRNDKGSHNPAEAMAIADFMQATRVLANVLRAMTMPGSAPACPIG
jgi:N-carbamoyl-L-amino-acid hydrolase